ncbi:MAG: 3-dehydroquinate synthase [Candidatus Bathyarchaeota archaeon]|nr:3-dehydroquinate synthase [Candidatus Bathyarchaeota archaeon]
MSNRVAATINLEERSYPILVGAGLAGMLGETISDTIPDATGCVIVTSPIIDKLLGGKIMDGLSSLNPRKVIVPDGEEAKTWEKAGELIGEFLDHDLDRNGIVVALGGGAVGDLAGLASSIYLRGVRIVQVPTTLLAMVDSSIGGKTAVNHSKGKNLIGTFHQPSVVIVDPSLIDTLPKREVSSGMAEVAKYGVIADAELFSYVEENTSKLMNRDHKALEHIAKRCAVIKARYVEQDEWDMKGVRAALNYGHTLGHAVERLLSPDIRHGEGVSIGMKYAAQLAVGLGYMKAGELKRQTSLLHKLDLPTEVPDLDHGEIIRVMRRDKKADAGVIRFVIPTGIGSEPVLMGVDEEILLKTLEEQQ